MVKRKIIASGDARLILSEAFALYPPDWVLGFLTPGAAAW